MPAKLSEVRDQVATIMSELVGGLQLNPGGDLSFRYETVKVFVNVRPLGDDSTVVNVFSITNAELTPSPELFEFVARHSDDWMFGHLALLDEGENSTEVALVFRHTLLGDYLDPEELAAAVAAVATTADTIDDQVKEQFGGSTASGS
jgi:Putative bacterial sensory transduction regulator